MSPLQSKPASPQPEGRGYRELTTHLDTHNGIAWGYMHAAPRPCFTYSLLTEYVAWFNELAGLIDTRQAPVDYVVIASSVPGVYNLGGDLELFRRSIGEKDRESLLGYARACIEPLYLNAVHLNRPNVKTLTLVQGDALGGGFECADRKSVV